MFLAFGEFIYTKVDILHFVRFQRKIMSNLTRQFFGFELYVYYVVMLRSS